MPEMPEVETLRRDLDRALKGKKISKIEILDKKIPAGVRALAGDFVKRISRVGKLLIVEMKSGQRLLIHLKMTGQLIYLASKKTVAGGHSLKGRSLEEKTGGSLPNKHTRALIRFSSGGILFFNDLRRFGYFKLADEKEFARIKSGYGPEPLAKNFSLEYLRSVFQKRKTAIKSVLMNQRLLSGIGNIYADEILFDANINPRMAAGKLLVKEIEVIFKSIKKIIKKAVKYRGTTFSDYRDASGRKGNFSRFLKIYGREGKRCVKCGSVIKKTKLGGRGTRFCSKCQK